MTFGSLFSGIGGLDLGLERAGMECRWQVENDPYCVKVLEKHWPKVRRYGDIRRIKARELEKVDLVCGGFPCQPVSIAGRRKGQADERWLWPEFARVLGFLHPRLAFVENTPGLASADTGEAMGALLGDLSDLGYDAEWDCIPACAFGAPHIRYRVFLLAHAKCSGRAAKGRGQPANPSESWPPAECLRPDQVRVFANLSIARLQEWQEQVMLEQLASSKRITPNAYWKRCNAGEEGQGQTVSGSGASAADYDGEPLVRAAIARGERHAWTAEPGVVRMVHGLPRRVDPCTGLCPAQREARIRALGNAVVPQVAEWIGQRILKCYG